MLEKANDDAGGEALSFGEGEDVSLGEALPLDKRVIGFFGHQMSSGKTIGVLFRVGEFETAFRGRVQDRRTAAFGSF